MGKLEVCEAYQSFQNFSVSSAGTEKLRYTRTLWRSADKSANAVDRSILRRQYNRVKSPGARTGVYSGTVFYPFNNDDLPPPGEVHYGVMKLTDIRRASDDASVTVDRHDIQRTHFSQQYELGSNCP